MFAYADVPYEIADHEAMVRDPRTRSRSTRSGPRRSPRRQQHLGSDGRLAVDVDGALMRVGLLEKLLVPALAKLTNFVPEGGIWLNTQRPEWNDANNALAGPGLSMVTLYHLHRYLRFVGAQLGAVDAETVAFTTSVAEWSHDMLGLFERFASATGPIDDHARRSIVDSLGVAGSRHRRRVAAGSRPATGGGFDRRPATPV